MRHDEAISRKITILYEIASPFGLAMTIDV